MKTVLWTLIVAALVVLMYFLVFQQGKLNRGIAEIKGFTRVCVDGVSYLQFPSGASVQYNPDGSIVRCD